MEFAREGSDAFDILTVISPGSIARAELFDAASLSIDKGSRPCVRAFVENVRYAVFVAVDGEELAADSEIWQWCSVGRLEGDTCVPLACYQLVLICRS